MREPLPSLVVHSDSRPVCKTEKLVHNLEYESRLRATGATVHTLACRMRFGPALSSVAVTSIANGWVSDRHSASGRLGDECAPPERHPMLYGQTRMELGLTDKVALVGGGGQGLGRATAEVLAAEGAAVAIFARDIDALAVAAEQIAQRAGARVVPIASDVTSAADCERVVERTVAEFGRLDVLVTNMGGPPHGGAADRSDEEWQRAWELVTLSVIRLRSSTPSTPAALDATLRLRRRRLLVLVQAAVGRRGPTLTCLPLSGVAILGSPAVWHIVGTLVPHVAVAGSRVVEPGGSGHGTATFTRTAKWCGKQASELHGPLPQLQRQRG